MEFKALLKANYKQVFFVFVAFLAMVLVSNFYVIGIVREQMQVIGDCNMDTTQTSVSVNISEAKLLFASVVQDVERMLTAGKNNTEILEFLKDTNAYFNAPRSPLPDFMKVYAHIDGEWLDGSGWIPPPYYVPESRPWHIGAEKNSGRIFFSEPYKDADTGGVCISFSQKLFDHNGKTHGVLAIDLLLTRITSQVRDQKIAGNGYGVLIDDKMRFIVHRNPTLIGQTMPEAGGEYSRLARLLEAKDHVSAARFLDADGTESVVFFRTVFNGWHIGVIIPRTSYYSPVYSLAFVLGVLGLFLSSVLSYLLIRLRADKIRSDEESLSKSTFLARMSHEMRTPMNAIIGMVNIAKASDDPEKKEYCLSRINEASNHLLGVINDVLDISKIEAGKLEMSESDFRFSTLLRQVETVINYKIEEKQQNLAIEVEDDVPAALVADRQRLAQAITNLLSNANKFTPEGGHITMRVRRLSQENGICLLQFEVEDDGIGIDPGQQGRLFKPFEQADGTISRKYGGTGLGLAITKRIIEMMGGAVWVNSEPGHGSHFFFTVKAGVGHATEETGSGKNISNSHEEQKRIFAGKRILLAEDVEINREILISLLEGTGVLIDSAENGKIACDMFAANPEAFDMIFMDIHMPEMDGYDAAKYIRSLDVPEAKSIPIVAMTANVYREDIERCLACGMNDHVGKPLEIKDVLLKMEKYMAGRTLENTAEFGGSGPSSGAP